MMRSFKSIYYVIPAIYYLIWINLMGTSCLRGLRLQTKQVNIKKKKVIYTLLHTITDIGCLKDCLGNLG